MEIYIVKILDISEENLNKLSLLVDIEKRNKIKRFVNKKDKIRSLIGDLLIRNIIYHKLDIKDDDVKFRKNKYGKPFLKNYKNFDFNISHSGNFIVCAIADNPIGIDIEEIKYFEYEEIIKSFFTSSETNYILKKDLDLKLRKFYEIWTLKESYIKCCGEGMTIPLQSFSIYIDKFKKFKINNYKGKNDYKFKSFDIESDYKMAVCSLNEEITSNIKMIDQNILVNSYLR